MQKIIPLLIISIFLTGCSMTTTWTGFYYPDKNNIGDESTWVIEYGFDSLEECRDWVDAVGGNNPNYDYECGSNCRGDVISGYICEETIK